MSILTNLESLDDQDLALLILSHLVRYDPCRQEVSGCFDVFHNPSPLLSSLSIVY